MAAQETQNDITSWKNQKRAWLTKRPESPTKPKPKAVLVFARLDADNIGHSYDWGDSRKVGPR